MPQSPQPDLRIQLISVEIEERATLENLLQLYCHDFSQWIDVPIQPDGRFLYAQLDSYWSEPDRHAFFIHADGGLAGFVLVQKIQDSGWDMAEFFVLRGLRRRGVGIAAARSTFERFPGNWTVRVMEANHAALAFWRRATMQSTAQSVNVTRADIAGTPWTTFAFHSRQV